MLTSTCTRRGSGRRSPYCCGHGLRTVIAVVTLLVHGTFHCGFTVHSAVYDPGPSPHGSLSTHQDHHFPDGNPVTRSSPSSSSFRPEGDDELLLCDEEQTRRTVDPQQQRRRRRRSHNEGDSHGVRLTSALSSPVGLPPLFWNEVVSPSDSTTSEPSSQRRQRQRQKQHVKVDAAADAADKTKREARLIEALTQPLIADEVWQGLTGTEFCDHADILLGPLAAMGERLVRSDSHGDAEDNEWIHWTVHNPSEHARPLHEGAVHIWIGRTQPRDHRTYRGANVPFIKSRCLLPQQSVTDIVDLLLDSARIREYNPYSTGRRDVWVRDRHTRIAKNRVQPPMVGSKPMLSTTLLHARPSGTEEQEDGTWIVVSRAVGGTHYDEPDDDRPAGRTNIYLGCNVLQPIDDGTSCVLTAVTHAESSAIPPIMAERLGVKGALNFVKDLRQRVKAVGS